MALSVELQVNNGKLMTEIDATPAAIGDGGQQEAVSGAVASSREACCALPESLGAVWRTQGTRRSDDEIGATPFEDKDGDAFVLDREGRVAASFERLHWDEGELVERAARVLAETAEPPARPAPPMPRRTLAPWLGTLAALGVALFPKCPICWAAYLSAFGVAGLGSIPYSPWLQPLLAAAVLANLGSMWMRGRVSGRMSPFWLAGAGALLIAAAKLGVALPGVALAGVAFTLAGSALSVALGGRRRARVESGERGWRGPAAAVAGS